jgi:hypothetical protein
MWAGDGPWGSGGGVAGPFQPGAHVGVPARCHQQRQGCRGKPTCARRSPSGLPAMLTVTSAIAVCSAHHGALDRSCAPPHRRAGLWPSVSVERPLFPNIRQGQPVLPSRDAPGALRADFSRFGCARLYRLSCIAASRDVRACRSVLWSSSLDSEVSFARASGMARRFLLISRRARGVLAGARLAVVLAGACALGCSDEDAPDAPASSCGHSLKDLVGGWQSRFSLRACLAADQRMWIGDTEYDTTGAATARPAPTGAGTTARIWAAGSRTAALWSWWATSCG